MLSMELSKVFTKDIQFKEYVSRNVYPPVPVKNLDQPMPMQELKRSEDAQEIVVNIQLNMRSYIKYIKSAHRRNDREAAVKTFLINNLEYVPHNIRDEYYLNTRNLKSSVNNLLQNIIDENLKADRPCYTPGLQRRVKSSTENIESQINKLSLSDETKSYESLPKMRSS